MTHDREFARRRVLIALVALSAVLLVSLWVLAVVYYDPWRHHRVRDAMALRSPWSEAVVAAESAAFPAGDAFLALCGSGDGLAAAFERKDDRYSLQQWGRVEEVAPNRSERVLTSEEYFGERASWAKAVLDLGVRLNCDHVTVIFPRSDAFRVRLDSEGRGDRIHGV